MKTLYININSEKIGSSDTLDVLEYDLINDFYFVLGEKILATCPVIGVDKIKLFTDYIDTDSSAGTDAILEQWSQLKTQLLGESHQLPFTVYLPDSYLSWLKYNGNPDYCRLAEKLSSRIEIDLEEFYEDCIEDLGRKIIRYLKKNDVYKQIDKLVFGDKCVAETAKVIQSIKNEYPNISFVTLREWEEEQKSCDCKSEIDEGSQHIFVTSNGDSYRETYEVYDSTGRKFDNIEYILPVAPRYYDDSRSFIIGLNTRDDMLYFVSNKQILSLCDWSDGVLVCKEYNEQLQKYRHRTYGGLKQLFIDHDNASFRIRDRYDYETHFKVDGGFCYKSTEEEIRQRIVGAPYYKETESNEAIPKCLVSLTGEEFTIPGFKAIIYLGNTKGRDVFWASKKFQTGQVRFKESYIVDSEGNVVRKYDYNVANPLCGKYVFDVNDRGRIVSISDLDGNQLMIVKEHFYVGELNIDDVKEVEPEVFYIPAGYGYNVSLYWLAKENVICDNYDRNFYYIGRYIPKKIYKRSNNELVGYGDKLVELDGIFYCQNFEDKGNYYMTFFDNNGEEIYRLNKDRYFRESVVGCGDNSYCVGENRIVIDFEGRYYKILDYTANEIARIDPVQLVGRYRKGKLFYYDGTKLGFFDIEGKKHILPFDNGYIKSVDVISNNRLLVKTLSDVEPFYLLNFDGDILLEGVDSEIAKFDHRYIAYYKEPMNYTACYVADLDGNELFKTDTSPCYVSVIDGGMQNE